MPPREELTFIQKCFIVQQLAQFSTPVQPARAFKEEIGFEIARNRVAYFDPIKKTGAALAGDLKVLFNETRKAFLADIDNIPIANKAVQLRALDRALALAEDRGQIPMVIALVEAAAKIAGTITNKHQHEVTGKDGGAIETADAARERIMARLNEIAARTAVFARLDQLRTRIAAPTTDAGAPTSPGAGCANTDHRPP